MAHRDVHLTSDAQSDLSAILDYISDHNPLAAGAMAAKFDALFRRISVAPGSGARSTLDKQVRWRVLGNYLVYYEVDDANDRVIVLAVIHGARVHHRMRAHQPP